MARTKTNKTKRVEYTRKSRLYRGNPLLRRQGINFDLTIEQMEELDRCEQDPIYFCRKYVKVVHVDYGLVNLDLYSYQEAIINSIRDNRYTIVNTARQSGKTTSIVGYCCWYILFHPNVNVALLANKAETAREIMSRVKKGYQHLPQWMQQGVIEWNKGDISLENGSGVRADATSSDAIRGYSYNVLIIDEAAHIEEWEDFFTSTFPTISSGKTTKLCLISTPKGLNHFHSTWVNAHKPVGDVDWNGYNAIQVMWHEVPGRDEAWRSETMKGLNFDLQKFAQEFECEFMGSSGTLISGAKLKDLVSRNPKLERDNVSLYKEPIPHHIYCITGDVSEGKGLDYSVMQVIDVTSMPYHQVCVFRSNRIVATDFAEILYRFGKVYNNAVVLLEFESLGPVVAEHLHMELEYENILFTENAGTAKGKRITSGFGVNVDKGIKMTKMTKKTGCSLLKMLIEQDQLILNNKATIEELYTFSRHNDSWEAEEGKHDDTVMALVVFAWLSNQDFFRDYTDVYTLHHIRDRNTEQLNDDLAPFGFIHDGQSEQSIGYSSNDDEFRVPISPWNNRVADF